MARPFMDTLRELRNGRTHDELTDALAQLVAAVQATGRSGELKLVLKVVPPKGRESSYLTIEDAVTVKEPATDQGNTVFFPTADGSLSRQDPSQLELRLRGLPSAHAPDGVDASTGEITTHRSA